MNVSLISFLSFVFGVGRDQNKMTIWEEKLIETYIKLLTPDLEIGKIGKLLGVFNRIFNRLGSNYQKLIYKQVIKLAISLNEVDKQKLVFDFLEIIFKKNESIPLEIVKGFIEFLVTNLTQTKNLNLFNVII